MSARIATPVIDWTDRDIENEIQRVQDAIKAWLVSKELWYDCGFKSQLEHDGCMPCKDEPVFMYFWAEGVFQEILYGSLEDEFSELLDGLGYWYSYEKTLTLAIRSTDDVLANRFYQYLHWQWTCSLLVPDTGDVYEELYAYFARYPERLQSLHWRKFEILIFRILQSQGFRAILGPGSGDGGVDIQLWQTSPLGEMLTVVQAKRYAKNIDLVPVQALYGVSKSDKAAKALFVTSSDYTPAARRFAARHQEELELRGREDIITWCDKATNGVVEDKSALVSYESSKRLIAELRHSPDARVVHAVWGFNMVINSYAVVIKETKHAALLLSIGKRSTSVDVSQQMGAEVPVLDGSTMSRFNADGVFRATRHVNEYGQATYWDGTNLYSLWDKEPNAFHYLD